MSATPITINKNQLKYIASDAGQPFAPGAQLTFLTGETEKVSPGITNGAIYFATKDNASTSTIQINGINVPIGHNRAYIFLDDNSKRYAVTGPVDWNEVLNKPLDDIVADITIDSANHYLQHTSLSGTLSTQKSLPFVLLSGDTMTGPLGIAASTTTGAPKVQLSYNATTESLDFTFT